METTDPQVTGRRLGGSFTIPEWCEHRRVSISMYYKLKAQGKAPETLPIGRHRTITPKLTPLGRESAKPKPIRKKVSEILHPISTVAFVGRRSWLHLYALLAGQELYLALQQSRPNKLRTQRLIRPRIPDLSSVAEASNARG
jgi:hypothetical protein